MAKASVCTFRVEASGSVIMEALSDENTSSLLKTMQEMELHHCIRRLRKATLAEHNLTQEQFEDVMSHFNRFRHRSRTLTKILTTSQPHTQLHFTSTGSRWIPTPPTSAARSH